MSGGGACAASEDEIDVGVRVCDLRFSALRLGGELREPAKVAVVDVPPGGADAKVVKAAARRLAQLFDNEWQIDEQYGQPTLCIMVVGGAQAFSMPPRVERCFRDGLVRAALTTSAWVFTGGTASGVMAHVGQAFASHPEVPCIGIALYGNVLGRPAIQKRLVALPPGGQVEPEGLQTEEYAHGESENSSVASALEPHHSHFVLVNTGREGAEAWGGEVPTMVALVRAVCKRDGGLPAVLLVVQGGPHSLAVVAGAVERHIPCVIMADSGGAASAIRDFLAREPGVQQAIEACEARLREAEAMLREAEAAKAEHDAALAVADRDRMAAAGGSLFSAAAEREVGAQRGAQHRPAPAMPTGAARSGGSTPALPRLPEHAAALRAARVEVERLQHQLEALERGLIRREVDGSHARFHGRNELRQLRSIFGRRQFVRLFELGDDERGASDISDALLESVASSELGPDKKLELAVMWGKPQTVTRLVGERSGEVDQAVTGHSHSSHGKVLPGPSAERRVDMKRRRMAMALQLALEQQQSNVVSFLLANGARPGDVRLSRLYMLQGRNQFRLFAGLQAGVVRFFKELEGKAREKAAPTAAPYGGAGDRLARRPHELQLLTCSLRLVKKSGKPDGEQELAAVDGWLMRSREHMRPIRALLSSALHVMAIDGGRGSSAAGPTDGGTARASGTAHGGGSARGAGRYTEGAPSSDVAGAHARAPAVGAAPYCGRLEDVFFWAVLMGNLELSKALWRMSSMHVRLALLACDVYVRLLLTTNGQRSRVAVEGLRKHWASVALGVLTRVRATGRDERSAFELAQGVLSRTVRGQSLAQLALELRNKEFVACSHYQRLVANRWLGAQQHLRLSEPAPSPGAVLLLAALPFHWAQRADEWACAHLFGARLIAPVAVGFAGRAATAQASAAVDEPSKEARARRLTHGTRSRSRMTSANDLLSRKSTQAGSGLDGAYGTGGGADADDDDDDKPAFWHVYKIPAVKFWTRALVTHGAHAAILTALIVFTPITAPRALLRVPTGVQAQLEVAFAVWAIGCAADSVHTLPQRWRWMRTGLRPAWVRLDQISLCLNSGLVLLRTAFLALLLTGALAEAPRGAEPALAPGGAHGSASAAVVAFCAQWLFPLVLACASISAFGRFAGETLMQVRPVGQLAICAGAMLVENLLAWLALMACLIVGFGLAFVVLVPSYEQLEGQGDSGDWSIRPTGPFFLPVFASFGEIPLPTLEAERPWAPALLLIVLLVLAQLLMLNLLIAMMADTYTRVMADAIIEWQFSHALLSDWCDHVLPPSPPPLNLLVEPIRLCVLACCARRASGADTPRRRGRSTEAAANGPANGAAEPPDELTAQNDERRAFLAFAAHEDALAASDVAARVHSIEGRLGALSLGQMDTRAIVSGRIDALAERLEHLSARLPDVPPRPRPRPGAGARLHVLARSETNASYRGKRSKVPDSAVPWLVVRASRERPPVWALCARETAATRAARLIHPRACALPRRRTGRNTTRESSPTRRSCTRRATRATRPPRGPTPRITARSQACTLASRTSRPRSSSRHAGGL